MEKQIKLTLASGTIVTVISQITKRCFKVSYGKDTRGNEVIGLVDISSVSYFHN